MITRMCLEGVFTKLKDMIQTKNFDAIKENERLKEEYEKIGLFCLKIN